MSLQIKKPLSAQAVGTHMYKDGGVNQMKPATKQPEWSTKSLAHYRETEKKTTSNVQDVQPHIMHESETRDDQWKVTDWHHQLLDLRLHDGREAQRVWSPPCDSALWEHGKPPHSGLELRRHVIEIHARSRRRARVSDPALGILEWFSRAQRADRGRRIRTCHHTRSSLHVG